MENFKRIDEIIKPILNEIKLKAMLHKVEKFKEEHPTSNEIPNYLEFQPIHYYTPRGVKQYPFKYTDHDSVKYIREMDGYHLFEMVRGGKVNMVFCKIGFKKK